MIPAPSGLHMMDSTIYFEVFVLVSILLAMYFAITSPVVTFPNCAEVAARPQVPAPELLFSSAETRPAGDAPYDLSATASIA